MADIYGKGSDLPTGKDESGQAVGGGPYPPLSNPLNVKDHPDSNTGPLLEMQYNHRMDTLTRRGGPGPLLNDWSNSFSESEK